MHERHHLQVHERRLDPIVDDVMSFEDARRMLNWTPERLMGYVEQGKIIPMGGDGRTMFLPRRAIIALLTPLTVAEVRRRAKWLAPPTVDADGFMHFADAAAEVGVKAWLVKKLIKGEKLKYRLKNWKTNPKHGIYWVHPDALRAALLQQGIKESDADAYNEGRKHIAPSVRKSLRL